MPVERRRSLAVLAACAAAGLIGLAGAARADEAALAKAAKQEGEVVYYTSKATPNAEGIAKGFTAKYGIPVKLFRAGGTQIGQKLMLEIRSRRVEADVAETSDPTLLTILYRQGAMEPYAAENGKDLPPEFKHAKGAWYGSSIVLMHLIVNADKVSEQDEPRTWSDLADPKWKGKLVWGSPNYGSSQYAVLKGLLELHGWDLIEAMKKNDTMVIRGWPEAENAVASGERVVGGDASSRSFRAIARGVHLRNVYPKEGSIVSLSAIGMLKGAAHPNAAKLLIEYVLSDEGQRVYAKNFAYPVRKGVPAGEGMAPIDGIKLHTPDSEQAVDQHDQIVRRWTQMMER